MGFATLRKELRFCRVKPRVDLIHLEKVFAVFAFKLKLQNRQFMRLVALYLNKLEDFRQHATKRRAQACSLRRCA